MFSDVIHYFLIQWYQVAKNILSVSLKHSAVTSCCSYLEGKGQERQIKKTKSYTTVHKSDYVCGFFNTKKETEIESEIRIERPEVST